MDYLEIIAQFMTEKAGGIYIKKENDGCLVYLDTTIKEMYKGIDVGSIAEDYLEWEREKNNAPIGQMQCFDYYDFYTKHFWLIRYVLFEREKEIYRIVNMVDITEFMQLSKEVAETVKNYQELDRFKRRVLERFNEPYYTLLPIIGEYVTDDDLLIIRKYRDLVESYHYDNEKKRYKREIMNIADAEWFFVMMTGEKTDSDILGEEYECIVAGAISDTRYSLLKKTSKENKSKVNNNVLLYEDLKLYIENNMMNEEILYESEHDKMTGLFNKGKYLSKLGSEYMNLDSVAIFNFDVNYLKQTNDTYGHEAGDALLKRAADSIHMICKSDNIQGYRMGGDEFLVVAENISEEEIIEIKKEWEEALEKINENTRDIPCIVAVGIAYGEKDYDFSELMKIADGRMYDDKRRKKKPGEEIR